MSEAISPNIAVTMARRRLAGERVSALAAEIGVPWQKLEKATRAGRSAPTPTSPKPATVGPTIDPKGQDMRFKLSTVRGYALLDVASALQKAIRRGDARLAGYWTIELFESNYRDYMWRRLLTVSAEDCWGVITHEIEALYRSWQAINKQKPGGGRIFAAKAAILLAQARKSRDADHLTNLVYDPQRVDEKAIEADLEEARKHPEAIPEYAFDCHTTEGKKRGKTREMFFKDEQAALKPRQPGLFDVDVDKLIARKSPVV